MCPKQLATLRPHDREKPRHWSGAPPARPRRAHDAPTTRIH